MAVAELPGYLGKQHTQWSHYVTAEFPCNIVTRILPGQCPGLPRSGTAYAHKRVNKQAKKQTNRKSTNRQKMKLITYKQQAGGALTNTHMHNLGTDWPNPYQGKPSGKNPKTNTSRPMQSRTHEYKFGGIYIHASLIT